MAWIVGQHALHVIQAPEIVAESPGVGTLWAAVLGVLLRDLDRVVHTPLQRIHG